MKKSKLAAVLAGISLLLVSLSSCDQPKKTEADNEVDGVYEYLPPLKGQSVVRHGHFVFLFGPSDGKGQMIGQAGTYRISGDTVKSLITYSTDSTTVGTGFWWRIKSVSGDVFTYDLMNDKGEITGSGSAKRTSR